jgi:hypothetical protein
MLSLSYTHKFSPIADRTTPSSRTAASAFAVVMLADSSLARNEKPEKMKDYKRPKLRRSGNIVLSGRRTLKPLVKLELNALYLASRSNTVHSELDPGPW